MKTSGFRSLAMAIIFVFLSFTALEAVSLEVGKEVPFLFDDSKNSMELELNHPGDRLLAIAVHFDDASSAEASLKFSSEKTINSGKAVFRFDFERDVFFHDGKISLVDNLKPAPGKWQIKIAGDNLPASGKLELIDLGPVPQIDYSDKSGIILIRKPGVSVISAYAGVEHPDFKNADETEGVFHGSLNADGDVMIQVPVGLYRLSHPSDSTLHEVESHLIPVFADRVTQIDNWLQAAADSQAVSDPEKEECETKDSAALMEREMNIRSFRLLDQEKVYLRFATPHWRGTVKKDDLEIEEGGIKSEVLSAGSISEPLDLVILLDSSGSMKNDMKAAIDSLIEFINQLPEETRVEVIDFDTKPREIAAKSRKELISAIKKVKADGATALNDSVMLALKKLSGKNRPAILLFTDGFDANHNDTGPGSKTRPEEMFEAVKTFDIPVFTIGFGKKPDDVTLKRLATLSKGFYSKADQKNLRQVFEQLASILGREHEMVYRRPGIRGNSEDPVISIVLDISGSMNAPPTELLCDYRMEKAKRLLRNLINSLPEGAICKISTYHWFMKVIQIFTSDKTQLLASLAPVVSGGGTATFETLEVAFKMLKEIPSDRKYMLFITDAGLEISEDEIEKIALLGSIKDSGIQMTWIGIIDESEKAPFEYVAKLCNGHSFVSTDFDKIQEIVDRLNRQISAASSSSDLIPIKLAVTKQEEGDKTLVMNASDKFRLPQPPVISKASVNGMKISFIDKPKELERYAEELGANLYGTGTPREETVITQRFPVKVEAANNAMRVKISELIHMSQFRGFNMPCVALKVHLTNILPEQEIPVGSDNQLHPASIISKPAQALKTVKAVPPYLIPNAFGHFFAGFDENETTPLSDLSLLVEEPVVCPDDSSITLSPGETIEGYMVFTTPQAEMPSRLSFHFFDSSFGNIDLAIIGSPQKSDLPQTQPSVSFKETTAELPGYGQLTLTAYSDQLIEDNEMNISSKLVLRTYEMDFTSGSHDFIEIDPAQQLSLVLPTVSGDLNFLPSLRNLVIPQRWYKPVRIVPLGTNKIRQCYVIPQALATQNKGMICFENSGSNSYLNPSTDSIQPRQPLLTAKKEGLTFALNAVRIDGEQLFLDISIFDDKDGTGIEFDIRETFTVTHADTVFSVSEHSGYMFALTERVVINDGRSCRGLLCFDLQGNTADLALKSEYFGIDAPLEKFKKEKFDAWMLTPVDAFIYRHIDAAAEIQQMARQMFERKKADGWKRKGSN